MAYVESRFNKQAVSPKGACGIMQVMPKTAAMYDVCRQELFDEDINIQVGLYYLKEMLRLFKNRNLAVAAYNCGPNRVIAAGYRVPKIRETIDFVRRVNNAAKNTGKKESHNDSDLLLDTFDKGSKHAFENEDDLELDYFSDKRRGSEDIKENKETNQRSDLSFFKRLLSCTRRKKVIGAFLGLSFIFHFLIINSVYRISQTGEIVEPARHKITSRIKLIEDHKTPEKPQTAKPTPPVTKKPVKTIKPAKSKTVRAKKLSSKKLVALGKKYMSKVREGEFPLLTLSYSSPSAYVKEMYELGAKTLIYDRTNREFFEINLFSGEILPFSRESFKTFSFFKRVIKDSQWNSHKNRVASRVNASPDSLEILLLVWRSAAFQVFCGLQSVLFLK